MSEGTRKKLCGASSSGIGAPRSSDVNTGILDEHVLALVFRSINFDLGWWPPSAALPPPTPPPLGHIVGGWPPFAAFATVPSHFTTASRFSKTSGQSFVSRRCRGDLLYVLDPCEHAVAGDDHDDVARTAACSASSHGPGLGCAWWGAAPHWMRAGVEPGGGRDGAPQRVAEAGGLQGAARVLRLRQWAPWPRVNGRRKRGRPCHV
jgi:hypothetical protein